MEIFSNDFVFNLNANLTRPIFLNFLVDKLEEALYTDSAGCFFGKLDYTNFKVTEKSTMGRLTK